MSGRRKNIFVLGLDDLHGDDLYADNMHYMGGCLLTDNLSESTTMFSVNSCPPDPDVVGARWREMWFRPAGTQLPVAGAVAPPPAPERILAPRHGSVCEDYSAIRCAVMAVGGWADGYTNAVFRLLEHLRVPRLGLVGALGPSTITATGTTTFPPCGVKPAPSGGFAAATGP